MKTDKNIKTIGQLKSAFKSCAKCFVWVCWNGEDGDYVEVSKASFLRSIGADTPNDGAYGGINDSTFINADCRDDGCVYVN